MTTAEGNGSDLPEDASTGVHLEYKVDLSNPTPESLDAIKNELVQKIAANIDAEREGLAGGTEEMMRSHDRHYSIHSRD